MSATEVNYSVAGVAARQSAYPQVPTARGLSGDGAPDLIASDWPVQYVPGRESGAAPTGLGRDAWRTKCSWLVRPRRILLALMAVWVLNLADLGFTVVESSGGHFVEMNPVAAKLLSGPLNTILLYKFGLLGIGTAILLLLRRHSVAELACWFLLAAYSYVGVRWYVYYGCLLTGSENVFISAPN
ncbi:MAG: hypothetical protein KKB50_19710 [Planctomycetes bacterium]|nr:hypothetical protein [Planctomycetota bacterium]